MSLAVTWTKYSNTPPYTQAVEKDIPLLDLGTIAPNSYTDKFVIGLRFQGGAAKNIKVWLDGAYGDVYATGETVPTRENLSTRGYVFKCTSWVDESDDTTFLGATSAWDTLPTAAASGFDLAADGEAHLDANNLAVSAFLGLAVQAPSGESDVEIRNFR